MKEHTQKPGVRKWAGDDMIALQAEPLSAIQGFFEEYGNCIVQGCEVVAAGNAYNVTTGLLALSGMDANGEATFKVVPFSGVENVTLPLYFTLSHSVIDRVYGDGKVKPIAYDYRAAVSAVKPAAEVSFLELSAAGGRRFVDAVKITEKLDKTGNGKDVTVTFATAATREPLASGERLGGMFGKMVKWFSDLKALAFKDKVGRGDLEGSLLTEIDGKIEKADSGDAIRLYKDSGANYAYAKRKELAFNVSSLVLGATHGFDKPVDALEISNGEVNALNQLSLKGKRVATIDQIPTALPASDVHPWAKEATKPGYMATEVGAVSSVGTRTVTDCNHFIQNGMFGFAEYPANGPGVPYVSMLVVKNIETGYQLAGGYDSERLFFRGILTDSAFTPWKELAFKNDIPTSLPANGGNADTVGGSPAWRLQSVQKNGELYMVNQYDIQSRYNAKEDGRFRLEIVGFGDANIHKDSVSVGYADQANNADTLDGHHYNQFIHVVADRSIHADNVDGSLCGFGYDSNGFPTNGSFISFGGLGNEGKYITQIQAGYVNGNEIYFRTRTDDTTPGINHPWRRIALSDEIPTTTEQITDTAGRRYVTEMEKANWNSKAVGNHSHAGYALASHTHPYAHVDHVHEMTTVLSAMYEFPWNSRNNNVDADSVMGLWIVSEVIRNSVGQFTVRHTLGHKRYTLILTGGARASDSSAIISVSLVAREAYYFTVQTSVGDQFRDGGFYATILTF